MRGASTHSSELTFDRLNEPRSLLISGLPSHIDWGEKNSKADTFLQKIDSDLLSALNDLVLPPHCFTVPVRSELKDELANAHYQNPAPSQEKTNGSAN